MADMDNTPLKPSEQPFEALPVPQAACSLSILKTGTLTMPAFMFVHDYKGDMLLTDYSFLIEHKSTGRRVLFDLGLRKDLKYPSKLDKMFQVWKCTAPSSPQDILRTNGVDLDSIDTVIFSHTHFDHIGNVRDLPPQTTLQFGPYTDTSKMEDKQKLADSLFIDVKDVENRKVNHLSDAKWETYGNLKGYDFFGDGSLILLDTPGHMEGHLGALVCVSTPSHENDTEEPLYYFLGGDAAHHISLIDYEDPPPIGVFKAKHNEISPLRETEPESLQSMDVDLQESKNTLARMARQDHEPNINVLLAHDETLEAVLQELNNGNEDGDFIRLNGTKEEHLLFKNRKRKEKGEA